MKRVLALSIALMIVVMTGGCVAIAGGTITGAQKADELARNVAQASGRDVWPRVSSVAFTFVVREGENVKVSRSHLWNVRTGVDVITVAGKTTTININNPTADDPADAELQKAWSEDTQWLLTPLRLFVPGVKREYLGQREVAGKMYEVLHLSFDDKKAVPPAAGDQYDLYVDPFTNLIAYSDYIPADKSSGEGVVRATWEDYRHSGGLTTSTLHRLPAKTITLENLSFAVE
jgi:hypothetical protein